MPMPLSSHTNNTGAGNFWCAVHAAALNAVCALAWLAEASPNEQTTMLSSGTGNGRRRRLPASIASAVPSALGRCEAIVEVCGSTHNGLLPHTLWRPPLAGSSALAAKLSAESITGSRARPSLSGSLRKRSAMKPPER